MYLPFSWYNGNRSGVQGYLSFDDLPFFVGPETLEVGLRDGCHALIILESFHSHGLSLQRECVKDPGLM